jgi:IS4 transposase
VTRLKSNADVEYLPRRSARKAEEITDDQQIRIKGVTGSLGLVGCTDQETGKKYRYVTNAHHLKAVEVAEVHKERWKIEEFFKWVKQNLKIKTFLGSAENAVLLRSGSPCVFSSLSLSRSTDQSWGF